MHENAHYGCGINGPILFCFLNLLKTEEVFIAPSLTPYQIGLKVLETFAMNKLTIKRLYFNKNFLPETFYRLFWHQGDAATLKLSRLKF